jgi:hypothetical protein
MGARLSKRAQLYAGRIWDDIVELLDGPSLSEVLDQNSTMKEHADALRPQGVEIIGRMLEGFKRQRARGRRRKTP